MVVINDRGPFTRGLHLDLGRSACSGDGLTSTGVVTTYRHKGALVACDPVGGGTTAGFCFISRSLTAERILP